MTVLMPSGASPSASTCRPRTIPGIALTVVVGSITFCVLGYALSTVIRYEDAAQPMVQAVMLPLYFISGIFIPNVNLPHWLQRVAPSLPGRSISPTASSNAYDPTTTGVGIVWVDIAVLALWARGRPRGRAPALQLGAERATG